MDNETSNQLLRLFKGNPSVYADWTDRTSPSPNHVPISSERISEHLVQKWCAGFYLCDQDFVWCSALDIDNHDQGNPQWKQHSAATQTLLRTWEIPHLVEVSQSGSGSHLWIFLEQKTPAWEVRRLWAQVWKESGLHQTPEIYPRQDRISHLDKNLGNLIRFPLWNKSKFVCYWSVETGELSSAFEEDSAILAAIAPISSKEWDNFMVKLQLDRSEPPKVPPKAPRINANSDQGQQASREPSSGYRLPKAISEMLEADELNGGTLYKAWNGGLPLGDNSRSGVMWGIVLRLLKRGVNRDLVEQAVGWWCEYHRYENGIRTLETTLDNAERSLESTIGDPGCVQNVGTAWINDWDTGAYRAVRTFKMGIIPLERNLYGGIRTGETVIIAARPGHGKSLFCLQTAWTMCHQGLKCLFISLEMGWEDYRNRLTSIMSGMGDQAWEENKHLIRDRSLDHLTHLNNLVFYDNISTTDGILKAIDKHNPHVLFLDYMQKINSGGMTNKENMDRFIAKLDPIQKARNLTCIFASQLKRDSHTRASACRSLDTVEFSERDLMDSDIPGQWAKCVLVLGKPYSFNPTFAVPNRLSIWIAKRRGKYIAERVDSVMYGDWQWIGQPLYQTKEERDGDQAWQEATKEEGQKENKNTKFETSKVPQ